MSRRELTDAVSLVLAAGTIVLQVLLAALLVTALVALAVPRVRRVLVEIRESFFGKELWAAWVIALVATLGSLYFSEVAEFQPCRLCWMQRIAMYPLAVVLLVGALRRDVRSALQYSIAFPIAGAIIAAYHLYIEANPDAESKACKQGVPCSTKWIDEFGYVTIPMLAITAFLAIGALLAFAWSRRGRADGSRTAP